MNNPVTYKNKAFETIIIGLLFAMYLTPAVAGWPSVAKPPNAELAPLAGDLNYNGINMRAWVFQSPASVHQVLQYYRNRWADQQVVENQFGPWQQISYKSDNHFITVQVQNGAGRGSTGRISIMELNEHANTTRLARDVPMMRGSKVLNDITSNDAIRNARSVALVNTFSLSSNVQFYQDRYRATGWGLTQDNNVDGKGHLLVFKKSADEITVVINRKGNETAVMINEVSQRGWLK